MVRRSQSTCTEEPGRQSLPAIGKRNIAELRTRDLLAPIKAVEASGRLEVASRLQQRTTAIMRYAVKAV
jgi:hypothetical protein